jgi:hypothetical protein
MSGITKPEILKKVQPPQFQRSTIFSKVLIFILKGNVNVRERKRLYYVEYNGSNI